MRFLVTLFCLCGTVAGFAQETTASEEVVVAGDEVVDVTDSNKDKDCGCGKPKL